MVAKKTKKDAASPGSQGSEDSAQGAQRPEPAQSAPLGTGPSASAADAIARESLRLYNEWIKIIWGTSDREISPKDPRFADSAWRDNPVYHRIGQAT